MHWWIWLIAAVVLAAIEMLTPGGFYFLFFGAGAAAAALVAAAGVESTLVQSIVLLAVSIGSVAFFREPLLRRWQPQTPGHVVDSLVGETAILEGLLHPGEFGQAELRGSNWKVRNVGSAAIAAGQRCIVEQVDGLTLNVRASD
jgi:membrane protein implicated in regulation of membrane protease activity